MISHKHKCIFIHIPKTGGMSIEQALGKDPKKLHAKGWKIKHGTPLEWKNPKFWDKYFTFTVVRNPWDRVISAYFFDLKMLHKSAFHKDRRSLIEKLQNKPARGFIHYAKNHLSISDAIYRPQSNWFKNKFDYVCKYENLQEDFDIVCNKIGMPRRKLPHKNRSRHKHYTEYYNDEARAIVAKKYAKDIERFGYEFGD